MNIVLNANEIRVLGCLLEKSVTTPDQYPLTLNALVNACNQKSSRNPVMSLDPGEVQRTMRMLEEQHVATSKEIFKSRVEKYSHRLCNTPFASFQFDPAQYAVVCLLMLRGPQTPGELRSRSGRLHSFADNAEVSETLQSLMDYESGAVVARLPRKAGRQDHEYAHLFSGDIESVAAEVVAAAPTVARQSTDDLEARVAALEEEVAQLRALISSNSNSS